MEYIFYKKNKDGVKEKKYRKLRDFLCYINGEIPIRIKKDAPAPKKTYIETPKEILKEDADDDREEFITYEEYRQFNIDLINNSEAEDFEPYQDGNDYIAPTTKREKFYALDNYAKKLVRKKDNGEYE
jgi:hypothetical protein